MKKELKVMTEMKRVTYINGVAIEGEGYYIDSLVFILKTINNHMELSDSDILIFNDRLYMLFAENKYDMYKYRRMCHEIKKYIKWHIRNGFTLDKIIVLYAMEKFIDLTENDRDEYWNKKLNKKESDEIEECEETLECDCEEEFDDEDETDKLCECGVCRDNQKKDKYKIESRKETKRGLHDREVYIKPATDGTSINIFDQFIKEKGSTAFEMPDDLPQDGIAGAIFDVRTSRKFRSTADERSVALVCRFYGLKPEEIIDYARSYTLQLFNNYDMKPNLLETLSLLKHSIKDTEEIKVNNKNKVMTLIHQAELAIDSDLEVNESVLEQLAEELGLHRLTFIEIYNYSK